MATYAIGDVQGCFAELQELLQQIAFDPTQDTLWFVGDLVNRGSQSLETLRFVKQLGKSAKTVLGNHDLHLLALAHGLAPGKASPELAPILVAPDREELLSWLLHRPLLHHSKKLNYTMIHAGFPPQWDLATAKACAKEVQAVLQSEQRFKLFASMYEDGPKKWKPKRSGIKRWRFIINCLTRLRYCDAAGQVNLSLKGKPGNKSSEHMPWYKVPGRLTENDRIIFGHWSTLGLVHEDNIWAIDTGCVWGGALTAIRLDDDNTSEDTSSTPKIVSLPCRMQKKPG